MRKALLIFLLLPPVMNAKGLVKGTLEYSVSMEKPFTHYFEVEISLDNLIGDQVDFKLPVWTPGSYLIREYAKNVQQFRAFDAHADRELPFQKTDKNTWRVKIKGLEAVTVKYKVYANEGSVRMSYLNDSHAFIMANTLLMYVDELRHQSAILNLNIPDRWQHVSTSLSEVPTKAHSYYIPDYDILVDSPIEIGNHEVIEFEAAGVPHEIAMYGKASYDKERLVRDISSIVEECTSIFDDNPNEKYVFIVHNSSRRGGGLEHLSSTVLGVQRDAYSRESSYNGFLSLVAHEYFHLWLVKRIKPVELERLNYEEEMYTDLLWVMEGLTSYFEEKVMLRCGFYDRNMFLNSLVKNMAYHKNLPGSNIQSVAEASFDAWIKYYRRNENSSNTQVSYYSKGMLLGALLDLEIINGSEGSQSLDDVLSHLYYQYYKKKGKGIRSEDFQKAAEEAGNVDLDVFFNNYVFGTSPLDNERYLDYAGINLVEINAETNSKTIGLDIKQEQGKILIKSLMTGSAAYEGGLNVNDELLAINEFRVSEHNIGRVINQYDEGDQITILFSRDGLIDEREIEIRSDTSVAYTYEIMKNQSKLQKLVFNTWLSK